MGDVVVPAQLEAESCAPTVLSVVPSPGQSTSLSESCEPPSEQQNISVPSSPSYDPYFASPPRPSSPTYLNPVSPPFSHPSPVSNLNSISPTNLPVVTDTSTETSRPSTPVDDICKNVFNLAKTPEELKRQIILQLLSMEKPTITDNIRKCLQLETSLSVVIEAITGEVNTAATPNVTSPPRSQSEDSQPSQSVEEVKLLPIVNSLKSYFQNLERRRTRSIPVQSIDYRRALNAVDLLTNTSIFTPKIEKNYSSFFTKLWRIFRDDSTGSFHHFPTIIHHFLLGERGDRVRSVLLNPVFLGPLVRYLEDPHVVETLFSLIRVCVKGEGGDVFFCFFFCFFWFCGQMN
jgi:hypothetical protein